VTASLPLPRIPAQILLQMRLPVGIVVEAGVQVPFVGHAGFVQQIFEDQRVAQPAVVGARIQVQARKFLLRAGSQIGREAGDAGRRVTSIPQAALDGPGMRAGGWQRTVQWLASRPGAIWNMAGLPVCAMLPGFGNGRKSIGGCPSGRPLLLWHFIVFEL